MPPSAYRVIAWEPSIPLVDVKGIRRNIRGKTALLPGISPDEKKKEGGERDFRK